MYENGDVERKLSDELYPGIHILFTEQKVAVLIISEHLLHT